MRPNPRYITDMIRSVPDGTFDSCLLAYSWNLAAQVGFGCIATSEIEVPIILVNMV